MRLKEEENGKYMKTSIGGVMEMETKRRRRIIDMNRLVWDRIAWKIINRYY